MSHRAALVTLDWMTRAISTPCAATSDRPGSTYSARSPRPCARCSARAARTKSAGAQHETPTVIDAEPAPRVDEREQRHFPAPRRRFTRSNSTRAELDVRLARRELRARVHPHPDELEVRRRAHHLHGVRRVVERHAELRLVVPGRDVLVRRRLEVHARVHAHAHARPPPRGPRPRLDARDLLDALDLHRPDAPRPARRRPDRAPRRAWRRRCRRCAPAARRTRSATASSGPLTTSAPHPSAARALTTGPAVFAFTA